MTLTIRKPDPEDPSRCRLGGLGALHTWSTYDLEVVAADFAADLVSGCVLRLLHEDGDALVEVAACALLADPYRRMTRTGTLVVGDSSHSAALEAVVSGGGVRVDGSSFRVLVELGDPAAVVLDARVPVAVAPRSTLPSAGGSSSQGAVTSTAALWSEVDLGTAVPGLASPFFTLTAKGANALAFPLADRSMTKVTVPLYDGDAGTFDVVLVPTAGGVPVESGPFDAYLAVTTVEEATAAASPVGMGSWASHGSASRTVPRLGSIRVGRTLPPSQVADRTSDPAFDYRDSATLVSPTNTFIMRLKGLPCAGGWHLEFRAERAGATGVELDPEGREVPGAGIGGTDGHV